MNTHEIKLPPLPEPDWYLVMSADGDNVNVELRTSDVDAVNAALDMGGMVEIHRLITIDKAEAYVKARVREALEKAASICEAAYEQGSAEYAVSRNPYFEGGCDAAEFIERKILALIPKEAT